MVRSFRWLGCCPVTAEIVSSSLIRTAPRQAQYYKIGKRMQVRVPQPQQVNHIDGKKGRTPRECVD